MTRLASSDGLLCCAVRVLASAAVSLLSLAGATAHALDATRPLSAYSRAVWAEGDGLTFGAIHTMAQDGDGYLWLGTDNGLVRFDGTVFVRWPLSGEAAPVSAAVYALLADRDGSLWIGGVGGLGRLQDGVVTTYPLPFGPEVQGVANLAQETNGTLWVGGRRILKRVGDTWQIVGAAEGLSGGGATALYADAGGRLWVSTLEGIFRRSAAATAFERITSYSVGSFSMDRDGAVWAADSEHGVHRIDPLPSASLTRFVGQRRIRMFHDRAGMLWIGTEGLGVWRMTSDRGSAPQVEPLAGPEGRFEGGVRRLLEDREGNVWIATRTTLLRLSNSDVTTIGEAEGLPEVGVAAVAVTGDQRVWVATSQGLYSVRAGRAGPVRVQRELMGSITALHVDAHDRLWLARVNQGVRRFEVGRRDGKRWVPVDSPPGTLLSPVTAFATDREGGVWMCDVQGVVRWHRGQLTHPPGAGSAQCLAAETDASGRIWFAFNSGGAALYADREFRALDVPQGRPGAAIGNPATIHAGRHAVWLNTPSALFRFQGGGWVEAARESPASGAFMPSIVEDANGHVWIGVSAGVARLNPVEGTDAAPSRRVFDRSSGFAGTVSGKPDGWPAAARSADGRLWFATSRGLAVIDPARLSARDSTRAPIIDRVIVDGREFPAGGQVLVPPGTAKLEIHYGALDLSAPQSLRFRYRLEGSDAEWVDAGTRRQAFYTNLAPRAYVFRVDVTSPDGAWAGRPSQVVLKVEPRFSQTIGFAVLLGCAGVGLVGVVWWFRLRVVRSRFDSILAERARVAREIHDTLLQTLGSIAIDLEAVTHQLTAATPPVADVLRELRKRVTQCVRDARDAIEGLRSPSAKPRDLVASLIELVGSVQRASHVTCRLDLVGSPRRLGSDAEEQLLRIAHEAVGNAVRHGDAHAITIELEYQREAVLLAVTDDGSGFDTHSVAHTAPGHWGIAIMRERASTIGGSFSVTSQVGKGTQVEVVLPVVASR